jgi:hypothetical protein
MVPAISLGVATLGTQTKNTALRWVAAFFALAYLPVYALASPAPFEQPDSDAKFVRQVRRIFGQFRHADLQQVFKTAQPVMCSELVSDNGEWREVGFFNENRGFGNWFRTSIAEIRSQLDVYKFQGSCESETSPLRVTTRFPVDQSLKANREKLIPFDEIKIRVNAPVAGHFERRTEAYAFDLPYLYRVSGTNTHPLYALSPPTIADEYAPEAVNRWECKAVTAEDITYRFLICRTTLLSRSSSPGSANTKTAYGTSAFSILTDGQEASTSVKLTFGDDIDLSGGQ